MARYTIVWDDRSISKNGTVYVDLDLSWLPNDILAVQAMDDGSGELEKGIRNTLTITENETVSDMTSLGWWPSVEETWQAASSAAEAAILAEAEAEAEAASQAEGSA
jgi:hypothetical protein